MLIVMHAESTENDVQVVVDKIVDLGLTPLTVPGPTRTAICVTGNKGALDQSVFMQCKGVKEVIRVTKPYKMVSREVKPEDTVIRLGDDVIGDVTKPVLISGPCSVESEEMTLKVAFALKEIGVRFFRAGAFKPRTSPYDFQGLGLEGLKILKKVKEQTGLHVVTEVMDTENVEVVAEHVDVLQVGTRNMQNYSLLKRLSRINKPVILKRGMSASLDEWLNAAEYMLMGGNPDVILCERGIRTHSTHSRNTLDLNVVPLVRELSHLPIIVDPSHGVGKRNFVRIMSRAALASGAQGLIVESHLFPDKAYSDQAQTVSIETVKGIQDDMNVLKGLASLEG